MYFILACVLGWVGIKQFNEPQVLYDSIDNIGFLWTDFKWGHLQRNSEKLLFSIPGGPVDMFDSNKPKTTCTVVFFAHFPWLTSPQPVTGGSKTPGVWALAGTQWSLLARATPLISQLAPTEAPISFPEMQFYPFLC